MSLSRPILRRRRPFDMHVLRMTAIAGNTQLLHLLPEPVCSARLTGGITGHRRVLGEAVEGIEILPYRQRRRGVDGRAVGRYAGLRLRREEMREGGEQRADAVGARFEVVKPRRAAFQPKLDLHHLGFHAIHKQLASRNDIVGPIDPGQARNAVIAAHLHRSRNHDRQRYRGGGSESARSTSLRRWQHPKHRNPSWQMMRLHRGMRPACGLTQSLHLGARPDTMSRPTVREERSPRKVSAKWDTLSSLSPLAG